MAGDHQFLLHRDDSRGDLTALPDDARPAGLVGRLVRRNPEPGGVAADPGPDRSRVLADPGGEHQRTSIRQWYSIRYRLTAIDWRNRLRLKTKSARPIPVTARN